MAQATTRLRLGTCVTNPATREPSVTASLLATLNELSGGRMDLGIGRGDSARRVLGKPPTSMKDLEEAVHVIRALVEGRSIEYEGTMLELTWSPGLPLPVWIAGYGPVALKLTGRIADGSMLQIGDPDLDPLVRLAGPRLGGPERARARRDQGHGRRAGPHRRPRRRPRSDPLVPGAREQPRRRPGEQVPARGPARGADDVRPHARGLRLPPPRRGRQRQRRVRHRRDRRPVLHPRVRPRTTSSGSASSSGPASTSSTCT